MAREFIQVGTHFEIDDAAPEVMICLIKGTGFKADKESDKQWLKEQLSVLGGKMLCRAKKAKLKLNK